jgi:hypothetical protein
MITESISVKGNLEILVLDENKQIKDSRKINNLVVAGGKNYIAARMTSNANVIMSHMAIGVANVAPSVSDTLLLGELARAAFDSVTLTANTISYVTTYNPGVGTGTLAEAGIFNNATANTGEMLCRTRFNEVNKAAGDTVVITWNVTIQ